MPTHSFLFCLSPCQSVLLTSCPLWRGESVLNGTQSFTSNWPLAQPCSSLPFLLSSPLLLCSCFLWTCPAPLAHTHTHMGCVYMGDAHCRCCCFFLVSPHNVKSCSVNSANLSPMPSSLGHWLRVVYGHAHVSSCSLLSHGSSALNPNHVHPTHVVMNRISCDNLQEPSVLCLTQNTCVIVIGRSASWFRSFLKSNSR